MVEGRAVETCQEAGSCAYLPWPQFLNESALPKNDLRRQAVVLIEPAGGGTGNSEQ